MGFTSRARAGGSSVIHHWANQVGESETAGNVWFSGRVLYSYSTPIAVLVVRGGKRAAVVSTASHSPTTSAHQSAARSAANHLPTFGVEFASDRGGKPFDASRPGQYFADYRARFEKLLAEYGRARPANRPFRLSQLERLAGEASRYSEFFGLKSRLKVPADVERAAADLNVKQRQAAARRRTAAAAAERRQAAAVKARAAEWVAGSDDYFNSLNPAFLRLRVSTSAVPGDERREEVETSGRVRVPAPHVKRAYRFLAKIRAAGRAWRRNGDSLRVGVFQVDEIDALGVVRAGCHTFEWEEVARFAKSMGWSADGEEVGDKAPGVPDGEEMDDGARAAEAQG